MKLVKEISRIRIIRESVQGPPGPSGPPGASGGAHFLSASFTYEDSNVSLGSVSPGNMVLRTVLNIDTQFDDPSSFITIGTSTANALLLTSSQSSPLNNDSFPVVIHNFLNITEVSEFFIFITCTATQGSGSAIITLA